MYGVVPVTTTLNLIVKFAHSEGLLETKEAGLPVPVVEGSTTDMPPNQQRVRPPRTHA